MSIPRGKIYAVQLLILLLVMLVFLPVFIPWMPGDDSNGAESQRLMYPINRDTFLSSVGGEVDGNNGAASRLKIKGPQEYTLLDADLSSLNGKIISRAVLHLRSAVPKSAPLGRLSVSTVAGKWVEGTRKNYVKEIGSSCFRNAELKKRDWSYSGSTVMDVVLGRGHTIWNFADCTLPDRQGWQACTVEPDVIAARVAGLSYGFFLYDDVGTTWSIKRGQLTEKIFPNRFFYSREKRSSAPAFEISVQGLDDIPPEVVRDINFDNSGLPPGQAVVSWITPEDSGGGRVLGYKVEYMKKGGKRIAFPRYLIPMAGEVGNTVKMHIQDIPFLSGEQLKVIVRAVDTAGNIGLPVTRSVTLSDVCPVFDLPAVEPQSHGASIPLPLVNGLRVCVVDLLDKINPVTGEMLPEQRTGYKDENHLFSARKNFIRLQGARNETVAFQVNVEGAGSVAMELVFDSAPEIKSKIFQFGYVRAGEGQVTGQSFLPDPLVPLTGTFSIPSSAGAVNVPNQHNLSLICELYIPHDLPSGTKSGQLVIASGKDILKLDISLKVWNFTLPNSLSFVPEMNAYSTVSPFTGYAYYRLAHEHRTCLNRLPYGWDGSPSFAPEWKGEQQRFEWTEWDRKVGPLLDGTAFADLPRKGEPVDVLYLPVNENWPIPLQGHYTPSYWADKALDEKYAAALRNVFADFAVHSSAMGWDRTRFQFYLNNKIGYKKKNPRSSALWNFDEPIDTKDFWALRWYGTLFQSAIADSATESNFWFRADISYPQFSRNILSGVTDIEYIGGNNNQKTRQKHDENFLYGTAYFAEYGNVNSIEEANTRAVSWCLSAWCNGAVGVLPWQTIGSEQSWIHGDQTALFYPSSRGPRPSVRLKAFTRGQQDVEYLEIFRRAYAVPRWQVAGVLQDALSVGKPKGRAATEEKVDFSGASPYALWKLRYQMGEMISRKHPKYQRSLVDLKKPAQRLWRELSPTVDSASTSDLIVRPECNDSCFSSN